MSTSSSPIALVFLLATCGSVLHAQAPAVVSLSGPSQLRLGGSGQYIALVNGVPGVVVWSVNGYAGGAGSTGPISTSGFYTPALSIFSGHSVTISAATVAKPVSLASLSVKILNPLPTITAGSVTQTAPGTSFVLTVNGTGFVSGSQLQVTGVNTATTLLSSTELQSSINLPPGTTSITVGVLNPNAAQKSAVTQTMTVQTIPPVSLAQATRLLDQSTFGPTLAAVQSVQQMGVAAYLNQQFASPTTRMPLVPIRFHLSQRDVRLRAEFLLEDCAYRERPAAPARCLCAERNLRGFDRYGERAHHTSYQNLLADDALGIFASCSIMSPLPRPWVLTSTC